jgi:alanyl-tRNA synthetase
MVDVTKIILQEHSSVLIAIYTGSKFIASASGDEDFGLVLKSTSFYAEQGGQVQSPLEFQSCNIINLRTE